MNQPDSDATFNRLAPTLGPLAELLAPRSVFDRLSELGYRYVQLSAAQPGLRPRELDKSARRDLLATLRRREMSPAGVDLWIPPDHFLASATVDRAAEAVVEAIVEELREEIPEEMRDLIPDLEPAEQVKWIRAAQKKGIFNPQGRSSGPDSKQPSGKPPVDYDNMTPAQMRAAGYKS